MGLKKSLLQAFLAILLFLAASGAYASDVVISRSYDLFPGPGHGTAGAFIGALDPETIIVAGGSDFLDLPPWKGGHKTWLDNIWIIRRHGGSDEMSLTEAHLPAALGNGCAAVVSGTMYCFGGRNAEGPSDKVIAISRGSEGLSVTTVCSLPDGFVPAGAVEDNGVVFVHGTTSGRNSLYKFSPGTQSWNTLTSLPGATLSEGVTLVHRHNGLEDAIYLIGGRHQEGGEVNIAGHVWEYQTAHDIWKEKAAYTDDGKPLQLMYSAAVPYGSSHILVFGGDDGVEFFRRMHLEESGDLEALAEAFESHPGFDRNVYAYHVITDTWITLYKVPEPLPAVTTAVRSGKDIMLPGGEARPGVRSGDLVVARVVEQPRFGTWNYIVLIAYLAVMLGMGFYFSKRNNASDKFFKGGGKIPWWAAGISIFATALSAITFLSIPAKTYSGDWRMFMYNMAIIMVVPIVIHFFLPYVKKLKVASIYQYLEERFSPAARYMASVFFCLFMLARIAIVLFLPSLALNAVTGLDIYLCILLMGVITIVYSAMGGIEAVVWGDVIQGFLLVGGAIISLVWIISGIDGGLGTMVDVAVSDNKFHILDFALDFTQPVFWVTVLGGLSNQLLTYSSDQSVVQKYLTVKDFSETKRGLWLNGIVTIPVTLLFFSIGTALFVFFKTHPGLLSVGMPNNDSIYPHYMMSQLPAGVAGLLIAAVFAAAMSTLSSNINSSATVLSEDFYSRFSRGLADDSRKMRFARFSSVAVGLLGMCMALVLASFDIVSLWDQFNFFLGLLTSGVGGLFVMGVAAPRIGARSALTGFVASIVLLVLCNLYSGISSTLYGFIGLVSSFIFAWTASFIYGKGR